MLQNTSENNHASQKYRKINSENWLSRILHSYGVDSTVSYNTSHTKHENSSLLIKSREPVTRTVDSSTKITWRDFVPPVFFKLSNLIRYLFFKGKIGEVIRITYIELGIVVVFLGTLISVGLITFVLPASSADLAYSVQMYLEGARQSYVSAETVTKANQAKAFLEDYRNGVVLGIQGSISQNSVVQESKKQGNQDYDLDLNRVNDPDNNNDKQSIRDIPEIDATEPAHEVRVKKAK